MKMKCSQALLCFLLLLTSIGTGATVCGSSESCLYQESVAGNPFIQIDSPETLQTAAAYGRGMSDLKLLLAPLPESVPKPVPMYLLLFWIEWAYRV